MWRLHALARGSLPSNVWTDPNHPDRAVRVRGAGASDAGPARDHNEDAFGFLEDASAALAVVADGEGGRRPARDAAELTIETCARIFRGRGASVLDDLAEAWWAAEHGAGEGDPRTTPRARPYSALPIADRAELRERVSLVLSRRVPDSMGDVAVLEAETRLLLDIPRRSLERASGDIHRRAQRRSDWRGTGVAAACVLFAAGQASIAHAGDCRVYRVRGRSIEALTTEHTLANEYRTNAALREQLSPEEVAGAPPGVITRVLGLLDTVEVDTCAVPVAAGDRFLLATDGLWKAFAPERIHDVVRAHGVRAATKLVEEGRASRPDHPGDNLTAVVVEVL